MIRLEMREMAETIRHKDTTRQKRRGLVTAAEMCDVSMVVAVAWNRRSCADSERQIRSSVTPYTHTTSVMRDAVVMK